MRMNMIYLTPKAKKTNIKCDKGRSTKSRSHEKRETKECFAWGMLAFSLRISKVAGLAPMQFKRTATHGIWRVQLSSTIRTYSCLLVFVLNAVMYTEVCIELSVEPLKSLRMSFETTRLLYLIDVALMTIINGLAVLGAPKRINQLIKSLNIIYEVICNELNKGYKIDYHETKERSLIIVSLLSVICVSISHYGCVAALAKDDVNVTIICLYFFFYLESLLVVILEMQFVVINIIINLGLKAVNKSLQDLIYILDIKMIPKLSNMSVERIGDLNIPIVTEPINMITDSISYIKNIGEAAPSTYKSAAETVHRLILSYGKIADVMLQNNENYKILLFLIIGLFLLQFIETSFYILQHFLIVAWATSMITLQTVSWTFYAMYMIVLIEPAHRSLEEVRYTKILIGHLLRRVSGPEDPLVKQLNLFTKQLEMKQFANCPLGVLTMTRPLIFTIIGGVTTYLVIILQFRVMEAPIQ